MLRDVDTRNLSPSHTAKASTYPVLLVFTRAATALSYLNLAEPSTV